MARIAMLKLASNRCLGVECIAGSWLVLIQEGTSVASVLIVRFVWGSGRFWLSDALAVA